MAFRYRAYFSLPKESGRICGSLVYYVKRINDGRGSAEGAGTLGAATSFSPSSSSTSSSSSLFENSGKGGGKEAAEPRSNVCVVCLARVLIHASCERLVDEPLQDNESRRHRYPLRPLTAADIKQFNPVQGDRCRIGGSRPRILKFRARQDNIEKNFETVAISTSPISHISNVFSLFFIFQCFH